MGKRWVDSTTWSDHIDIRPTMMLLFGLHDDYSHDGHVLVEVLKDSAIPQAIHKSHSFVELAQVYKQINAPVGQLSLATLKISTHALESNAPSDATYTSLENQLSSFTSQRNALAFQIITLLEGAEFNGQPVDQGQAQTLISQAQTLLS